MRASLTSQGRCVLGPGAGIQAIGPAEDKAVGDVADLCEHLLRRHQAYVAVSTSLGVLLVCALIMRAPRLGVHISAPDFST